MTDSVSQRRIALTGGSVCGLLFLLVMGLVLGHWQPLQRFDTWVGTEPEHLTYAHHWLRQTALAIQWLFEVWPMAVLTVVVALLLLMRNHRRAAVWTVLVMVLTSLLTNLIKAAVGRDRPVWELSITTLRSYSFPSGHSSGIAAAASVATVLTLMLVRRRGLRRAIITAAVGLALVVGADRIFLGVHNLSDVIAGFLLGTAVAMFALALFNPTPKSLSLTTEALPEVYPSGRRLAVVLNPAKVDDAGAFVAMVEAMARESGWTAVAWYETTVEDPGVRQAHAAAVSGVDLVITCGGDGTVRTVCEELAGTGIPVGIVPAGTGNLLARNLNLPLYLRAAIDVALNGQDRAIDMVSVSGDAMEDTTFLVMAGMGFDAAMLEGVNEDFKAKVGWLAYVVSAARAMMFPAVRVEVSVDGGPFTKHRARAIVIGNVGYLQGGMPLIPDAEIDDGELDVLLLYPRRFLSWLPLAVRVLSRNKRTDELITRMRGRTATVRAATVSPRQLDGDLIAPGRELHAECVHGRVLVRVPR
ncbi:MAG: phosphatase PAP2 family protein [Marmoricola sp.]